MDVYSLEMNTIITVFVAALVFLLPLADRWICRRLRLNLAGGLSENPDADRLLRLRQRLLAIGVLLYLLIFAWLVFFSRGSTGDYNVHVAPLEDLKNAFSTPTGFSGWFRTLFREGVSSAFSQISIVRPEDISQFYLNVILFVPIGYLLPYAFRWFRDRVRVRPVLFCLLLSFPRCFISPPVMWSPIPAGEKTCGNTAGGSPVPAAARSIPIQKNPACPVPP